jgi:hypothetical protein
MDFLLVIKILKKYGINDIDIKILNRIENDKNFYIQSFIEFNIYQILTYFIYNHQFVTLKSKNLLVNSNKSGPIIQSNIILHPIIKNKYKGFLHSFISKSTEGTITLKNLNASTNYLFFLSINGDISSNNNEIIKCMNYYFIFIEKKNSASVIIKSIINKPANDFCLIEFNKFDNSTISQANEIFNSPYRISKENYLVAKLIATWQREKILTNILNEESNFNIDYQYCNIIGYSIRNEIDYIINNTQVKENLLYFYVPNNLLGLKWRQIAEFNKILNTDYLLIQGSDDKILLNKLNKEIILKYDFIGQNQWYIYNNVSNESYIMKMKYSMIRNALYIIGAGRIIKKTEVSRLNYNLFNPYLLKNLDYQMNCMAVGIANQLISEPICYSIKGNHKCLNEINKILKSSNILYSKL